MDRSSSRSKRYYYYDQQNFDTDTLPPPQQQRTKPRYNNHHHHHNYSPPTHRRTSAAFSSPRKTQDPTLMVTTSYRILCHDINAGGVIGKSGSIIKSIRQHTGAWINVHELIPGDEERIIEISDTRRRDPEGRMPAFSPAQEALFLIHQRILETQCSGLGGGIGGGGYNGNNMMGFEDEIVNGDGDYGEMRVGGNRVVTRLVVSRMHIGCLLGKGGKIIEQMRIQTKTHIRILPRDHNLPRCVQMSEEIVQVVGDVNAMKHAIEIISLRLRESQHRDRSQFHGRLRSPEQLFPPDDDFIPHVNNTPRRTSMDGATFGSRLSAKSNNFSHSSGYTVESGAAPVAENAQSFSVDDLLFRILCPIDKVDSVVGESDGIIELLQNEIGVDVKVADHVAGSEEKIIIISSEEGPDDELFPAQEAMLHIQTRIVDLVPEKENVITTRLLVSAEEIGCLEGRDGSLSDVRKLTGANIQILPREELPVCVSETDELVQIVGEIKAAREALVEVTSRLRNYLYREFFQKDTPPPPSAPSPVGSTLGMDAASSSIMTPSRETHSRTDPPTATHSNVQAVAAAQPAKDSGGSGSEEVKQTESECHGNVPSGLNKIHVPLVTRSTLEVVIPQYAVSKLITKSKNKLSQISELSGANVKLIEDRPEVTENIIQISGTPEQAERAQSLLQGFILSTQEDGP